MYAIRINTSYSQVRLRDSLEQTRDTNTENNIFTYFCFFSIEHIFNDRIQSHFSVCGIGKADGLFELQSTSCVFAPKLLFYLYTYIMRRLMNALLHAA